MAKESAEEKLLKMMQKSGAPVTPKTASPAAASQKTAKKFEFSFTIGHLNQILLLGIVACVIGLVYEMRSGMQLINTSVDLEGDVKLSRSVTDAALPTNNDVKFYTEKINTRNIFRPYEAPAVKAAVKFNLAKRLSKFKLVGVAWLDLPETASIMIEDTVKKETYFLKQGEQLDGVTVKTIYTDRAVFSDENEETTIKL